MKKNDFHTKLEKLLTPEICLRLCHLHEYRGRQKLLAAGKPLLETIRDDVALESVYAACALERKILPGRKFNADAIRKRFRPPTKNEAAAAGYLDTFRILENNHGTDRFDVERITEIHTELFFSYSDTFESGVRTCEQVKPQNAPFPAELLPPDQIDDRLRSLFAEYMKMRKKKIFDELLLISVFLADFTCIYPFREGFTRLFLLVTRLLLKRAGYMCVNYVAFESEFAKKEKDFQDAVFNSTVLWNQNGNDYSYFTLFLLDTLLAVCEKFETYAMLAPAGSSDTREQIKALLAIRDGPLSRHELSAHITSVTPDRIKQILRELTDEEVLRKTGEGKNTVYTFCPD